MQGRFTQMLLLFAGLATWAAVGIPMLISLVGDSEQQLFAGHNLVWLSAYLCFGLLFSLESSDSLKGILGKYPPLFLIVMTALAATAVLTAPGYGLMAVLFIITAVYAANVWPVSLGVVWTFLQTAVIAVALVWAELPLSFVVVQSVAYLGFQFFTLFTTYATVSESRAKAELAAVNSELRATQELLTQSSRSAERLRIARELHDLMGHHLTALSLNLEVAQHHAEGKAKEHVKQAQGLARLLLSDVRETVSNLREDDGINLKIALENLIADIPYPRIHLDLPDALLLQNPERAQVLLRCTQEMITNAIRHSQAANLWINVKQREAGLWVVACDDGKGVSHLQLGNGLRGMRERLEHLGGTLNISSQVGKGFTVEAHLPVGV